MKVWWLDDMRNPTYEMWKTQYPALEDNDVVWLKSFDEFCERLKYEWPDMIYFDHDLGSDKTGYDCANLIVNMILYNPELTIPEYRSQSSNPVGKDNILKLFNNLVKYKKL